MLTTVATIENASGGTNQGTVAAFASSAAPFISTAVPAESIDMNGQIEARVTSADVLVQLRSNLAQLEDLHGRLKFLLNEVSYLIRKD